MNKPSAYGRWKRCLAAIALAALSGVVQAEAFDLDQIRERGVLRVALYNDFPPYSAAGKGIDFDLAAAIAARLGVRFDPMWFTASDESVEDDLRNMVWKGHYLGTGPADAMIHAPIDPALTARSPRVRFVAPYSRERLAVLRDATRISRLESLSDLGDAPIGVEDASLASIVMLSEAGGRYRNQLHHFRSPQAAVDALNRGEIGAVITPWGEAQGLARGLPNVAVSPLPVIAGLGTRQWVVGFAVPKAHDALGDAIEAAMSAMAADGELDRIFERHGVTRLKP